MRSVTLILLFLLTAAAHAQTRTFTWSDELCEFEGRYDASKYSEAQLRNTTELRRGLSYGISVDATAWKIEDIPKLDVGKLDREYSKNRELLANLDIVNVPYWESVRQGRLKELDQVYRLSRATILGYRTPTSLLEYKDAEACVEPFAKPLIYGGDDLLAAWLRVNMDSRSKNADPNYLKHRYEEQYNSPERLKHAQVEVMMFGWWNCAIALVHREDSYDTHDAEFRKLFSKVTEKYCDEP